MLAGEYRRPDFIPMDLLLKLGFWPVGSGALHHLQWSRICTLVVFRLSGVRIVWQSDLIRADTPLENAVRMTCSKQEDTREHPSR